MVQNATAVPAYNAAIAHGEFAVARGVALSADDRLRRGVIDAIMCDLAADIPDELLEDAAALVPLAEDGLVQWDGRRVTVTERGRPFLRNAAAVFDAYLQRSSAALRHSAAV